VRGVWLVLYLVIDVCSNKVVACDVVDREDPAIAADLMSSDCLRERIDQLAWFTNIRATQTFLSNSSSICSCAS
jgi:hypothetical protein